MNTSTLQRLKRKASGIIEDRLLKTGRVLEVRRWEQSNIVEIDLHLPQLQMEGWNEVYYIKFKVADFTYRDYTPSGWDAETQTCTLYIDANHEGPGSKWARHLQQGDQVAYIASSSTRQTPASTSSIICLGDESAMGHLLALQQLTMPVSRLSGAIVVRTNEGRKLFSEYFKTPMQAIARTDAYGHHALVEWLLKQSHSLENTMFYLVGNSTMVSQLRKILRQQGYNSGQIKAHGFWS